MKTIKIAEHIPLGTHISVACQLAKNLAKQNKSRVLLQFNEIPIELTPKKSAITAIWEYELGIGRRYDKYRMSKRGREESDKRLAKTIAAQSALDHWMLILQDMLKSGMDNTIGWLSNFLPSADISGTHIDIPTLVGMFESSGYKENDLVGEPKSTFDNKENMGRYIIGQVLSCWKHVGAVPPIVLVFCEKYEEMRRNNVIASKDTSCT